MYVFLFKISPQYCAYGDIDKSLCTVKSLKTALSNNHDQDASITTFNDENVSTWEALGAFILLADWNCKGESISVNAIGLDLDWIRIHLVEVY